MNGFIGLLRKLIRSNGLPDACVYCERAVELPGWYRPEKKWDLLIVDDRQLVAAIEFKSQVGSFGNNYNNRTEEAIGTAVDLWAAFREGAFRPSERPWLGYLMLLEEASASMRSVTAQEPHFPVFDEFRGASYARRYEILLTKLVRERLYDGACFLMSTAEKGSKGEYSEPSEELSFEKFVTPLLARVSNFKAAQLADLSPRTPRSRVLVCVNPSLPHGERHPINPKHVRRDAVVHVVGLGVAHHVLARDDFTGAARRR